MSGQIVRAADRYLVAVNGGEISVKATEVEMACASLEEAYQTKRGRVQPDNIHDRLELVLWCQRLGMLNAAAVELSEAMGIDPNHPMIPVAERRLRLAMQGAGPTKPEDPASRPATSQELDRLVRGMPPGTVEAFTQTIQPLLTNNCATAGCHGPGMEQAFSLLRAPAGKVPSRRLTQRNLMAVVQWINRSAPAESPLLSAPTRPHGTARAPIFTDQQVAQYQDLVDWVYCVAQVPSPVARQREPARRYSSVSAASHEEPLSPADRFPSLRSTEQQGFGSVRARFEEAAAGSPPSGSGSQNPPRATIHRGELIPSVPPSDALDPADFNRRFAPRPPQRPMKGDPNDDSAGQR